MTLSQSRDRTASLSVQLRSSVCGSGRCLSTAVVISPRWETESKVNRRCFKTFLRRPPPPTGGRPCRNFQLWRNLGRRTGTPRLLVRTVPLTLLLELRDRALRNFRQLKTVFRSGFKEDLEMRNNIRSILLAAVLFSAPVGVAMAQGAGGGGGGGAGGGAGGGGGNSPAAMTGQGASSAPTAANPGATRASGMSGTTGRSSKSMARMPHHGHSKHHHK
jgi:hypothetical protein